MKISKITPVTAIPAHHLKWCGLEKKDPPKINVKKVHEISSGDFTLYNSCGIIVIHKCKKESYDGRC